MEISVTGQVPWPVRPKLVAAQSRRGETGHRARLKDPGEIYAQVVCRQMGMTEGMRYVGAPFDHAVSAFIEDVEARGLSDKIMLVACGEMGRTPRINAKGGRDHWGRLAPLMIYGGGLKMGQVIGRSTRDAAEPDSTPVTIPQLNATIMHALLDAGQARATAGIPREVAQVINGSPPIRELF